MTHAIDGKQVDKGPILDNDPLNAYYFIVFILIGSFFFLDFFVGMLFLRYKKV